LGRSFRFSAAGTTNTDYKLLNDRRKLQISAVYLDTISIHGIAVGTLCTLADYLMAFLHWRALLLGNSGREDGASINSVHESFCRALCLNQIPVGWEEPGSWLAATYHCFASLLRERLPRLPLDQQLQGYIDAKVNIKPEARRRFLQEHFGSRMMGRCFCLTQAGYLGIGTGFMTVGDVVAVPLGCATPIILRPERDGYRFVGDVYVDGYMYGEAISHWKSGERVLQKFVLH
jgi:hypothetical protein